MKIEQSHNFLQSFLTDVLHGDLLPAAMQRPYQWSKADVEAFCDSVLSRFPIGGFLIWAPGEVADITKLSKARLGPVVATEAPQHKATGLLLDGQHRLATLAWLMLRDSPLAGDYSVMEGEIFLGDEVMVLDYASRSMKFVSREQAATTLCLPAWTVFRHASNDFYSAAMKHVRKFYVDHEHADEESVQGLMEFWDDSCQAFMDARVSSTVIRDATPEQAKHAFLRICRTGVPMSAEDFDLAVRWAA